MRRFALVATSVVFCSTMFVAAHAALKFDAPKTWVSKAPTSSMRLAEFTVPKVAGDAEDASVTVFFFGASQGGNVQANIDRWIGQVAQPDGKSSKDLAKTTTMTSTSGLKITIVDVSGTYVAEVAPGSAERFNKTGFRQLAVYIDTPGGAHFVKLLGPAKTVAAATDGFTSFLKSLRFD